MYIAGKKTDIVNIIIIFVTGLFGLIIIYPVFNSVLASFMTEKEYIRTPFVLFPKEITFESYKAVFGYPKIATGYLSTLLILLIGLPYNMYVTTCTAYALSRRGFPGKKIIMASIVFTMYFSGGIIPLYLLVRSLGLMNSLMSIILVYGANTFYMLIMKNYFETIPDSIEESARMDGANDFIILYRIMLPLSLPIIATFLLFFAVDRWNEWFNALLFLRDGSKWPLQLVLREIVNNTYSELTQGTTHLYRNIFSNGIKMAAIVVTMTPIMIVYPFVQKYFMKGILIGAVKS